MKHSIRLMLGWLLCLTGCRALPPQAIDATRIYDSPRLIDDQPQIQRGEPRKVIDAMGWVWGIPSKLLLWDRRVENHKISAETEIAIADFLEYNQLGSVRVGLNQYRPGEDWRRLLRPSHGGGYDLHPAIRRCACPQAKPC